MLIVFVPFLAELAGMDDFSLRRTILPVNLPSLEGAADVTNFWYRQRPCGEPLPGLTLK